MAIATATHCFLPSLSSRPTRGPLLPLRIAACSTIETKTRVDTDTLRGELLQLHAEADSARTKANNARLRLLRLSEAAENLRRQAAVFVQASKEDEAREILLQKKKVLQALERSNSRILVLDKLAEKLNEAISVKETQLIRTVASELEMTRDEPYPVRIISPKEDDGKELIQSSPPETGLLDECEEELQIEAEATNLPIDKEEEGALSTPKMMSSYDDRVIRRLKDISSYTDFLDHLDEQLLHIEEELVTVLSLSKLVMESGKGQKSSTMQQILIFLEDVQRIRERISNITETRRRNI